eukprot:6208860-Pleurochrysis_carterae.AAC.1
MELCSSKERITRSGSRTRSPPKGRAGQHEGSGARAHGCTCTRTGVSTQQELQRAHVRRKGGEKLREAGCSGREGVRGREGMDGREEREAE